MTGKPCFPVEIRAERVWLRSLTTEDRGLFCRLYTDRETMRFIGPPLSVRQASAWFASLMTRLPGEEGQAVHLAILEKGTDRPLGICGVSEWSPGASELEAGILLLEEARSRGFAREGITALLRWLFDITTVSEVRVEFSSRCPAVRRLNESVGFVPRSTRGEADEDPDRLVWSVGRSSWYLR